MRWLADICYLFAGLVYLPVLIYQMVLQGKNRRGWRERLGHVATRGGDRPCIWIHGVSLGEINATRSLVQQLQASMAGVDVVVSSTTDTGYARARQLYPDLAVFRYPLDFSRVVARVLRRVRPTLIVLMELEVWYNLVLLAARRGIPVCVVNGRLTERSKRRLGVCGRLLRPMFSNLAWVGAQSTEIAGRFRAVGVPAERLEVVGSMKWDTAMGAETVQGADRLAEELGICKERPLIVLGSSGPGEEELLIDVWRRLPTALGETRLALVPRKPERFNEVARLVERLGQPCLRRSQPGTAGGGSAGKHAASVILGDSMGELRKFYHLADITVVGRSFVPMGGSDPMEAAALGKPVIVGPYTDNFTEAVRCLELAQAIVVARSPDELAETLSEFLMNPQKREEYGRRALQVVRDNQGATARTVTRLQRFLQGSATRDGM